MKRVLSLILACLFILSMLVPFAVAADYSSQPVDFWDYFLYSATHRMGAFSFEAGPISFDLGPIAGSVAHTLDPTVFCESSDDHLHHSSTSTGDDGTDGHGYFVICKCDLCGHSFKMYGEDLHDAYDTYLTDNNIDPISYAPEGGTGHWRADCPYLVYPDYQGLLGGFHYGSSDRLFYKNDSCLYFCAFTFCSNTSYDTGILVLSDHSSFVVTNQRTNSKLSYRGVTFWYSRNDAVNNESMRIFDNINPVIYSDHSDSQALDWLRDLLDAWYVFPSDSVSVPSTINIDDSDYTVNSFNFSTRTYNLTNDAGDNITITYGDNEYTVTNNTTNATNNYYYYITNNNSGGGDTPVTPDTPSDSGNDYTSILTQIRDLVAQILDKIGVVNVVLPADQLPEEVNEPAKITDWFTNTVNKFGWVNQLYNVTLQLFNDVSNDSLTSYAVYDGFVPGDALTYEHTGYTAPAVSLSFPEIELFGMNFGGYYILDFSWYAPYKPNVDALLSGFMWLCFVVTLFRRAPSIIRGGAAAESSLGKIDNYVSGDE